MSLRREELAIAAAVAFGFLFVLPALRKKSDNDSEGEGEEPTNTRLKFSNDCSYFEIDGSVSSDDILADLLGRNEGTGIASVGNVARFKISEEAEKIYKRMPKQGKDFVEVSQAIINEIAGKCSFPFVGGEPITLAQGILGILVLSYAAEAMKADKLIDIYAISEVLTDYSGHFTKVDAAGELAKPKTGFFEDNIKAMYQVWSQM